MFINKINGISNLGFKGYQHLKNDVGENVMKFNYPYDSNKETCEVQFFKAIPTEKYNYQIVEKPIAVKQLKPEGIEVNLQQITDLDSDETFAYKIVRKDKNTGNVVWEGPDTGVKVKSNGKGEYVFRNNTDKSNGEFEDKVSDYKYTLVSRKGTTPTVQGAGYLITPDSFFPGAKFRKFDEQNTGEIYIDEKHQKNMEGVIKTFSNVYGGSLAGPQAKIPELKEQGYKILFSTPTANGSGAWCLGYWNKNNMQVSPNMGTKEQFASFYKDLYKNGMKYVFDGTFTSEGLEGIHFQYALRWAESNPQSYYWFRMSSIRNQNLGLGAVPQNKENLRFRVVNAPFDYKLQSDGTYKKEPNANYDKNKETLFQIYDASQVSETQNAALDKAIKNYDNLRSGNELAINTHDDTLINYICQIDPKEYQKRIDVINELNKKFDKGIRLDTADGTLMVAQFSNFKIDKKTEGGFVTWDANTDMVKMNYGVSSYDEKINQAIKDLDKRYQEQKLQERGGFEVQDMTLQAGKYWTGFVKDVQTMYTAKTLGKTKTLDALDKLIADGKLPEEVRVSGNAWNNVLNGQYKLAPKGILAKDDVTVKALMRLPLDGLEFGENTVGVLSTSYFSNRATTKDTVGVSRFDLMKAKNPHLVKPYTKVYERVNSLYKNELKDFADNIINKINETSDEPLIDKNGDYTEYGEYVIELVGQDIAKYAMFKSLAGDKLQTKILPDGQITYDYDALKEITTLKGLGINAHNPSDEALALENKIEKGLKDLSDNDVNYVAESIQKRIAGTDTISFRLAEALTDNAGLGLDWRLDAAKDVMDIDSIRNLDASFDDVWNDLIAFQSKFVQAVKTENPNSYIVAELTDIPDIMADTTGEGSCPYKGLTDIGGKFNGEPDAMTKLFNETGITSEAAYSYFFTELLRSFSVAFDGGSDAVSGDHDMFKDKLDLLIETRSADFLRNLWTFMGNHDKPRMLHGLALDMALFHNLGDENRKRIHRRDSMQVLSGSKTVEDVPLELRMNVNNPEYFRTVSTRAVAMSKLLASSINEDLANIATQKDIDELNKALVDLTNGKYLGEGKNINYQRINIKELSSLDNAFGTILDIAQNNYGLKLTETEKSELLNKVVDFAKQESFLSKYVVNGDFDWGAENKAIGDNNRKMAAKILRAKDDLTDYEAQTIANGDAKAYNQYSIYAMSVAMLLRDAYAKSGLNAEAKNAIYSATADFVKKYNREIVEKHSSELPKIEEGLIGTRKQAYAARNLKLAIGMAIKQAEFNKGAPIENKEAIVETVYKSITEPAVAKGAMILESLKALPGIQTNYAGDELGMTGYDEKAKNIYLQNRNALPWSELKENNGIGAYRRNIQKTMTNAIAYNDKGLEPLANGTPYVLDICNTSGLSRLETIQKVNSLYGKMGELAKKIDDSNTSEAERKVLQEEKDRLDVEARNLRNDFSKIAYLMQNANGAMSVSIFDTSAVEHGNRVDYFAKYGLTDEKKRQDFFKENNIESINPNNKYVPILPKSEMDYILLGTGTAAAVAIPVGTQFINTNLKDKAKYVVKEVEGKKGVYGIFKEGGKIVMDGLTSKNGVMMLKKIAFKGNFNKQYHITSNPYKQNDILEEGKKLSVIAK